MNSIHKENSIFIEGVYLTPFFMYIIHKDMVVILANVLGILIIQERGIGIPKPRAWMAEIIKLD